MTEDIIFKRRSGKNGDIGEIILNRPQALNALTLEMCQKLHSQLLNWQDDVEIKAVVIRGDGKKAFCAGGDVRAMYYCKDDPHVGIEFFREEYRMNKAIYHFNKPYISFLDGVTMGGGAGVSLHGSHCVATENFSFAMPETIIGFFTDIGAGYFLNKCQGYFGYYLGLTGVTIQANDALALNLIQHVVASKDLEKLMDDICKNDFSSNDFNAVSKIIDNFTLNNSESELLSKKEIIDFCFSKNNVEDIFSALQSKHTSFSNKTFETMLSRSPISLKVTLAYLQKTKSLDFDDVMQIDFDIANGFLYSHDFFEGVRAALVDKDRTPRWNPPSIKDVNDSMVSEFFRSAGNLG